MKDQSLLPLDLPASIIITGDGQFAAANVLFEGEGDENTPASKKYLFQFPESARFPRVEFHNVAFKAMNILDLRMSKYTLGSTAPAWLKLKIAILEMFLTMILQYVPKGLPLTC